MKSQDTEPALDELTRLGVPDLVICCAQNGVDNERRAARRFADVLGMCVILPALHLEPGVVELSWGPVSGVLDIGRHPRGSDGVAESIAADLQASGFRSRALPDVMRAKYGKLLTNLGNVLDAACGPAAADPVPSEINEQAFGEGVACLLAAGIEWVGDAGGADVLAELPPMRPVDGRMRPGGSTWQSVARGQASLEADYLNGEIVLLGRLHAVATPVNEALQRLAWRMVRERLAPGSVDVAELLMA
jgi:2-dehydropantoate 2-reductase